METYDDSAFEWFCAALVQAGFSPSPGTGQARWTGPIRDSLRPLTSATRMEIHFHRGWPLVYAHVIVEGLRAEHTASGVICLWADDDPAQADARDIKVLWARLDHWATLAQQEFRPEDRALDAYMHFEKRNDLQAELPFADLLRIGNNGYRAPLEGQRCGPRTVLLRMAPELGGAVDGGKPQIDLPLKGVFFLRRDVGSPPRDMADVWASLTRKQTKDLERGLRRRSDADFGAPSGGYDFMVLAWPRHDTEHDAVTLLFAGDAETFKAAAVSTTPNDIDARKRRAGPDEPLLAGKRILVAGAGSVGGHVSVALAASGVGTLHLHDDDILKAGNLVRHVSDELLVGYNKSVAVAVTIERSTPWTTVKCGDALPLNPTSLKAAVEGFDLVIDCTGRFSVTAALAVICHEAETPLITGALFHQGALARVRRQAVGDTPIAARALDDQYRSLPPDDPTSPTAGFLELGCTAPINNASPIAVLATAADIAHAAVDYLTGRLERPSERIHVFRPLAPPFDTCGAFDPLSPSGPS